MNYQEFRNKIKSNYYETKLYYLSYMEISEESKKQRELYRIDRLRLQKEFELEFKRYIEFNYLEDYIPEDKWKTFFDYVYDFAHSEGYIRIFEFGIEIIEAVCVLFGTKERSETK